VSEDPEATGALTQHVARVPADYTAYVRTLVE
jgi:hypothetical protein